jgi:hypothetical protein
MLKSLCVLGKIFSYQGKDDECISLLILEYSWSFQFTAKLSVLRKEILHPWNELESGNPNKHRDSG